MHSGILGSLHPLPLRQTVRIPSQRESVLQSRKELIVKRNAQGRNRLRTKRLQVLRKLRIKLRSQHLDRHGDILDFLPREVCWVSGRDAVYKIVAFCSQAEDAPSSEAEPDRSCTSMLRAEELCASEDLRRPSVLVVALEKAREIELAPAGLIEDDIYLEDFTSEARDMFSCQFQPRSCVIRMYNLRTHKSGTYTVA